MNITASVEKFSSKKRDYEFEEERKRSRKEDKKFRQHRRDKRDSKRQNNDD